MQNKASKRWLGLAIIGCAVCCAVPLVAIVSGGAVMSAGAGYFAGLSVDQIICTAFLVTAGVAGAVWVVRIRARRASSCETSCKTDASCCESKEPTH